MTDKTQLSQYDLDFFAGPPVNEAEELRDRGMAQVLENAGEDWRSRADAKLKDFSGREMTGEQIRMEMGTYGIVPHHHNAWGAWIAGRARKGLLVDTRKTVKCRTPASHARRAVVWRVQ